MKEIVVISGKGGTGKTSLTASFAMLAQDDIIVADCDVDAADMHLLLKPDFAKTEDFYSGELAIIDQDECNSCNLCFEVCRFDAITVNGRQYSVDQVNCEGCAYCSRVCAVEAITMQPQIAGKVFTSSIKTGATMVHARLSIGAENSGKLVAKVKKEAKNLAKTQNKSFVLVDGSPGVGCPVVSSLSGADYVVFVTEPTVSGLHDLERVNDLVKRFKIKSGSIINKYDINEDVSKQIQIFLSKENITHIANLPYVENFTKAMTLGKTIIEYDKILSEILRNSWKNILKDCCE